MSRRLNPRERILAWVVGGTAALLLNLFVLQYFFTTHAQLGRDLARQQMLLKNTNGLLAQTALWEQRDAWLNEHQPKIENDATAGVQLLNGIQDLAKKCSVTIEQRSLGTPEHQARYTSVAVTMETKSTWKALHAFLEALQGPEQFVVVESARLNIDSGDQTLMRGHFRIAKWFAPK